MLKKVKLNEIADIRSGQLFRHKFENDPKGKYQVVQLKDVNNEGLISENNLYRVMLDKVNERAQLKKGDILFKAKTNRPIAASVDTELKDTIASANYYIIRPRKKGQIHSKYLTWFLNQKAAQEYYKKTAKGSIFPIVNKKALGEIIIPIPNKEIQNKIIKIVELEQKEMILREEIIKLREILIETEIWKAIKIEEEV
ncbi:MAG: restriction endonuclease subunit S [Candidatus Hodarchaeota archaeon]